MTKFLMSLYVVLLIIACDARPSGSGVVSVQNAGREKTPPVIAVSGSELKINGTTVWLGDTLTAWKRVLGGAPNCYDAGLIVTCVWHSNGLSIGTDHVDKTRVTFIVLDLTIETPELGERAPSWPKSPFHGTLELDGVPIHAKTKFRELRRQVPLTRELRCGGSDCGNPSAAFSAGANIDLSLASRSESSHILSFSISCSSTMACSELIPSPKR